MREWTDLSKAVSFTNKTVKSAITRGSPRQKIPESRSSTPTVSFGDSGVCEEERQAVKDILSPIKLTIKKNSVEEECGRRGARRTTFRVVSSEEECGVRSSIGRADKRRRLSLDGDRQTVPATVPAVRRTSASGRAPSRRMSSEVKSTPAAVADQLPPPCPPTPALALSPTPSEILRPEGFLARSPCGSADEEMGEDDEEEEEEEEEEDEDDERRVADEAEADSAAGSGSSGSQKSGDGRSMKDGRTSRADSGRSESPGSDLEDQRRGDGSDEEGVDDEEDSEDEEERGGGAADVKPPPRRSSAATENEGSADEKPGSEKQAEVKIMEDSGSEADSGIDSTFKGFDSSDANYSSPPKAKTPPPIPKVGSLTILAPSSLNNSVVNGTLSISPSSSLTITPSSALSITPALASSSGIPGSASVGSALSITLGGGVDSENNDAYSLLKSLAADSSSGSGSHQQNGNDVSNGRGSDLMQGYTDHQSGSEYMPLDRLASVETCEVCGERTSDPVAMEVHRASVGHYKCHVSSDCATVLFTSRQELTGHQLNTHGLTTPPAPTAQPPVPAVEQLAQQVERLTSEVLFQQNRQTPSPGGTPQFRPQLSPALPPPPPLSPAPQPGSIQPRPFASMANQQQLPQSRTPPTIGSPGLGKRPGPPVPPGQPIPGTRPQPGPPGSKQRRMDILLPDRHDDADCHVIAMQKRNDSGLQIQNVQGGGGAPPTNGFQLPNSISLTPRTGSGVSITPPPQQKKGNDANAVANILATRGITVTPAGGNRVQPQPQQQAAPPAQASPGRRQSAPDPSVPAPLPTLNLNSAISIIPTNQGRQGGGHSSGFAVPQGRIRGQQPPQQLMERPPRCPTVDLTQDAPPPQSSPHRGRPPGRVSRHTCQICDKSFATSDALAAHMASHRSPGKLPYRCNLCNAQYPTQQGLQQHKQTFHKDSSGSEMAIPVVDIKQPGLQARLSSLGIRHFLPLSQLQNQTGGMFGIPIVAIDSARNPAVCNLGSLGASNILSLGPLKTIGPR